MTTKDKVITRLRRSGIVTILRLDTLTGIDDLVEALISGGIECIEITMTTPGALKAIEMLRERHGNRVCVGAGTVLDGECARKAIKAGARFVVSPVFRREVVETCRQNSVVAIPGAYTPTEVLAAWEGGADIVKVFSARLGGAAYTRDLAGPFPDIPLLPTGGIQLSEVPAFVRAGVWAIGVGSAIADPELIRTGQFDRIARRANEYRRLFDQTRDVVEREASDCGH